MKIINISKGLFTIVDEESLSLFSTFRWQSMYDRHTKQYYARCHVKVDGKDSQQLIHRIITRAKVGEIVDHINGNTLDNRKCNLRLCTNAQNCRNKKKHHDNKSGFKGVKKHYNKWQAKITKDYVDYHLGTFDTPLEAAKAYNKKAKILHGKFARLNVISLGKK